jgi:galactokinase
VSDIELLMSAFCARFGSTPRIFSAPGRINLIGEHTDYNQGFVLPMAIDRRTFAAAAPRNDRRIRCYSAFTDDEIEFAISPDLVREDDWGNHIRGVVAGLAREGFSLCGADLLIESTVPPGSGLASSAALEIAAAYALIAISNQTINLVELAQFAQRAEHEFVGTRCGIMDQYTACLAIEGQAMLIDCRSLEFEPFPAGFDGFRFVICDTMVRHQLAASEYNRRREECEAGVAALSARRSGIEALRDVSLAELELNAQAMSDTVYRRCRHIISENLRTRDAAAALESGDVMRFGRLMNQSHDSLRDDYEVSCWELDFMVEVARSFDGVPGARMTGGGFGGCTINLVAYAGVVEFESFVTKSYQSRFGIEPHIFVCNAGGGVREEIPMGSSS